MVLLTISHLFDSLHKVSPSPYSSVSLPNGNKVQIDSIGSIKFGFDFLIKEIFHVPSFCDNLLFVIKMTKSLNCSVTFFPNFCILQDLATKKTIGLGKQHNGLYYFSTNITPLVSLSTQKANQASTQSDLWHKRLDHPSIHPMKHLTVSVPEISFNSNKVCDVCPLAKQTRLPFALSSISTSEPFKLIHCDSWEAFRVPSLFGAYYFLTIVDDFFGHTWVYLMRFKSETQSLLRNFFSLVVTQFNSKVKRFRVNNGREFSSMLNFFSDQGILFEHSCVSTPQQNGVAERKHRHILNEARALRFQSHLPLSFWGESVLTAVYLINRIPTPLLSRKTPFEKLYKQPPTYNHLHVFGCLCFATNVQP